MQNKALLIKTKATIRIWTKALIIQPIIFCFFVLWGAVIIIPFEIAGSIPGIIVFGLIMRMLSVLKIPLDLKWVLLVLSGILLALACSYLIVLSLNSPSDIIGNEDAIFLIPAPIAATLAIFYNRSIVNEYLAITNPENDTL